MNKSKILAASGAFLLAVGSAHAITVSGLSPDSALPVAAYLSDYSGVAELMILRSDPAVADGEVFEGCSGALLPDGISILTAAHCVAGRNGSAQFTAAYVTFVLPDGAYTSKVAGVHVDPLFDGTADNPNDMAVLTLAGPAPAQTARYDLYQGDGLDQAFTFGGYSFGDEAESSFDSASDPTGTLRVGENQHDAASGDGDYRFDLDDATAAPDALDDSPGLEVPQAFAAYGYSGGPSFIHGEIAGVHSLVSDDVRVWPNAASIHSAMGTAPEPKAMFLVGIALVAVSLVGSKRRQH